ncbi:MAG: amidohydrolase family protein, partial [Candidatus Limnocylindria bacterium]
DGVLALFDAHIHYSQDAWARTPPKEALAILARAGVRRALVSSTPDAGTLRLYELAPDVVVPILRPYRTRDDIGGWTRDGTIVAYLESAYRKGIHRGIGEFHLLAGEASTPVVRAVVALAVREDLLLHAHADERAVEELLRVDPRAKVIWAHAGMSAAPQTVGALLDRHPRLVVELALRTDVAPGGALDPAWRAVFVRHADRFMVGTDTWVPGRWDQVVDGHRHTRAWLSQLPREVAERIASGNAERLFGR